MMHVTTKLALAFMIVVLAGQLSFCQFQSQIEPPPRPAQSDPSSPTPGASSSSSAATNASDPVRVWCWDLPRGQAMNDPRIIGMVRVMVSDYNGDPKRTADAVCDQILSRNLSSDQICILLQNLGVGGAPGARGWKWRQKNTKMSALWAHPADGLSDRSAYKWWRTPWMEHGVADTRQWMNEFIEQYKHRQQTDNVPAPSRFYQDIEWFKPGVWLGGHKTWPGIQQDPRFESQPLLGFDGRTLGNLYREAGEPSVDVTVAVHQKPNDAWRCWYENVSKQVAAAALNEAIYIPVREAWPSVPCTNYATAECHSTCKETGGPLRVIEMKVFADVMAPVFYGANRHVLPDVKRTQENWPMVTVESSIKSLNLLSKCSDLPIVPWIHLPGQEHPSGNITTGALTRDLMQRALEHHDIREWQIWSDRSVAVRVESWNALHEAVTTAYGEAE